MNIFSDAVVKVLEVSTSDHLPLFLDLSRKLFVTKRKRFRFENIWIHEHECFNIIQNCWRAAENTDILQKMVHCSVKLEEWGGGLVKEMRES